VIRFTHVDKHYSKGAALKDVSLHIAKGEFVFLTGHSGAGKSTMLKMMFAELMPTSGDVRVSGFNVNEIRPREIAKLRRRLGIVFQDFRLLEDRTAEENVAFALEVTGAHRDVIPSKVMRVLTQVGLAAKSHAYPTELSGGEQQRVAIAAAAIRQAPLVLADEPTAELDEANEQLVLAALHRLRDDFGSTVVVVTHSTAIAESADRVIEIVDGRIA